MWQELLLHALHFVVGGLQRVLHLPPPQDAGLCAQLAQVRGGVFLR
jgi:hypothetical protein